MATTTNETTINIISAILTPVVIILLISLTIGTFTLIGRHNDAKKYTYKLDYALNAFNITHTKLKYTGATKYNTTATFYFETDQLSHPYFGILSNCSLIASGSGSGSNEYLIGDFQIKGHNGVSQTSIPSWYRYMDKVRGK